jgi:hypothetical protein
VTNELTLPKGPAPIVNVKAPVVNVTAEPVVTVLPPPPGVTDVRLVESLLPPRTRTVSKRDGRAGSSRSRRTRWRPATGP